MKLKAAATSTIPANARASTLLESNSSARSKKPRAVVSKSGLRPRLSVAWP